MGLSPFSKSCFTNSSISTAPNPSPSRWELMERIDFKNSYVLKVKYLDAINFEGIKIMVYKGKYKERAYLDPHFQEGNHSPIARFKPTLEGWSLAIALAETLSEI